MAMFTNKCQFFFYGYGGSGSECALVFPQLNCIEVCLFEEFINCLVIKTTDWVNSAYS